MKVTPGNDPVDSGTDTTKLSADDVVDGAVNDGDGCGPAIF